MTGPLASMRGERRLIPIPFIILQYNYVRSTVKALHLVNIVIS